MAEFDRRLAEIKAKITAAVTEFRTNNPAMLALISAGLDKGIEQLKQEALNAVVQELTKPSNQDNAAVIRVALETDIDAEFKKKSLALGKIKNFSIMAFAKNVLFNKRRNAQQEKQQLLQRMIDACKQPSPLTAPLTIEQIKEILPKLLRVAKQAAEYTKTVDWLNSIQDWVNLTSPVVESVLQLSETQKTDKDKGTIVEVAKVANGLSAMLALGVKLDNLEDGGLDKLQQIRKNIVDASKEFVEELKATPPSTVEAISQAMPLLVVVAKQAHEEPSSFGDGEVPGLQTLVSTVVATTVKLSTPESGEPQDGVIPASEPKDEKDLIKLAGVAAGLSDIAKLGDDFVGGDQSKIQTINENINKRIKELLAELTVKNSGELDVAQIKEAVAKLVEIANQAKEVGVLDLLNSGAIKEWGTLVDTVVGKVKEFAESQEAASKQGKNLDEMIVLAEVAGELKSVRGLGFELNQFEDINTSVVKAAKELFVVKTRILERDIRKASGMKGAAIKEMLEMEVILNKDISVLPPEIKDSINENVKKHKDTMIAVQEFKNSGEIKEFDTFTANDTLEILQSNAEKRMQTILQSHSFADQDKLKEAMETVIKKVREQKSTDVGKNVPKDYQHDYQELLKLEEKINSINANNKINLAQNYKRNTTKYKKEVGMKAAAVEEMLLFSQPLELVRDTKKRVETMKKSDVGPVI